MASGFGGRDAIDLADLVHSSQTTVGYSANAGSGGTLTVSDGTQAAAITLIGNYASSGFAIASDGQGGTLITAPAGSAQPPLVAPHQ